MATTQTHLTGLSSDVISKLNDLVSINIDSAKGFETAAKHFDIASYRTLFEDMGRDRAAQAKELQREVWADGERPTESGSLSGKAHRWWLEMRDKMSSTDAYAVLDEAERGEDVILGMYKDIVEETAGSPVNDLLRRQYSQVKAGHDRVRALRDSEKQREDRK